jgi:hypothetical protein
MDAYIERWHFATYADGVIESSAIGYQGGRSQDASKMGLPNAAIDPLGQPEIIGMHDKLQHPLELTPLLTLGRCAKSLSTRGC